MYYDSTRQILFDTDFAAPDKREGNDAYRDRREDRAAEARAHRTGYDAAQREAKVRRPPPLALEEIAISIKAIAARASTASRTGRRPKRRRRSRGCPQTHRRADRA